MRVNAFSLGLAIEKCGGTPPPIEMTSDRFAQDLFPDLDLIAQKGFNDEVDERDKALATVGPDCQDLLPGLAAYEDWRDLFHDWTVLAETTQAESTALAATKAHAAACLRDRSGLTVDDADPTTYLRSVNIEMSADGTTRADSLRYASIYAECTRGYFNTMGSELAKRRSQLVERNRELLERFARELAGAGYVP